MQNVLDFAKSPSRRLSTAIEFAKATTQPLNLQTHKIRVELIMNGYTVFEKIHEYLLGLYHMHNRMYPRRGEHSAPTRHARKRELQSASFCLLAFLVPVRESNGE
jgi:inorganic triphosphatase YgiF